MNQKEKELFLELCAFRDPNAKKIESLIGADAATPEVLGMLFANRMAGVAYHVLKESDLLHLPDREFRNSLRNAAEQNEKINQDFIGCIKFLSAELEACGVPYALLKGAYLCHRYPKGCRTSNDIDVLIAPENVSRVSTRLKMAGFRQGHMKNGVFVPATRQEIIASKMMRGETVPFIKETKLPFMKYFEVDLNFSLDYKNNDDTTLKEMLSRTQLVSVGSVKIRTLEPLDFLLHLCAHLYKEATTVPWIRMKRDMTLYKYCDIYALLFDLGKDTLKALLERSQEMQMENIFRYCMDSVERLFGRSFCDTFEEQQASPAFDLDKVIAPGEKKTYRYVEKDVRKRFFSKNRMALLEVTDDE